MSETVIIGGNTITNCQAVLMIEDVEVFRLRDRTGDGRLVVDFEIRDEDDNLIVKVAKNNVVHKNDDIEVIHGKNFSEARNTDTGEVLARVDEIALRTIKIVGEFFVDGFRVKISEDQLELPRGNVLRGNRIEGFNKAIALNSGSIMIGLR